MVNFSKFVGKYICIKGILFVYIFPSEQKSRFREDDHEYIYWSEYPILGGGDINDTIKLVYDALEYSYNVKRWAKASDYKIIKQEKWEKELVKTIFNSKFSGVDSEFFKQLRKLRG